VQVLARKLRFLGWLIALAVALPVPSGGWAVADEGAESSPAARDEAGTAARPAIGHAPLRAGWHGACASLADPSDEPDEGSDGWVSALEQGLPAPFGLDWVVGDAPGIFSHPPHRPPLAVGTLCRLRC
jgi:hypothetical protein